MGSCVAGALAMASGLYIAPAGQAYGEQDDAAFQYGFLINANNCVNCGKCVEACRAKNALSDDTPDRRRIITFEKRRARDASISISCMHCMQPSCLTVCPAGAIVKSEGGIVSVRKELCIGCKYCYQACPYDVPRYNSAAMDKCDCCLNATEPIALGDTPYCVRSCRFGGIEYGLMDTLEQRAAFLAGEGDHRIAEVNNPSCLMI